MVEAVLVPRERQEDSESTIKCSTKNQLCHSSSGYHSEKTYLETVNVNQGWRRYGPVTVVSGMLIRRHERGGYRSSLQHNPSRQSDKVGSEGRQRLARSRKIGCEVTYAAKHEEKKRRKSNISQGITR